MSRDNLKQIINFIYATSALIICIFFMVALSQLWLDFTHSTNACVTPSQINIKEDLTDMFLIAMLTCYFLTSAIRGIIDYNNGVENGR